jgi:hypothetical protein
VLRNSSCYQYYSSSAHSRDTVATVQSLYKQMNERTSDQLWPPWPHPVPWRHINGVHACPSFVPPNQAIGACRPTFYLDSIDSILCIRHCLVSTNAARHDRLTVVRIAGGGSLALGADTPHRDALIALASSDQHFSFDAVEPFLVTTFTPSLENYSRI